MKIRNPALIVMLAIVAAGCDRQGAAWDEASQAGTVAAYQQFLQNYPQSPHADEARQRVHGLERAERWKQAQQADTLAAYQDFLADFSGGDEVQQARQRVAELERLQAWRGLQDSTDMNALRDFAEHNRGTPVAEQARQRIDELESAAREAKEQARREEERRRAEEASHTHRVQLAAYGTAQRAHDGERLLQQRLSDTLGETTLEVEQSGRLYLLRTAPLTEQDASALCDRLKGRGQDCLVVKR